MIRVVLTERVGKKVIEQIAFIDKTAFCVGRSKECDIVLQSQKVSKIHTLITVMKGKIVISDNASTNGTYINGRRAAQAQVVAAADKVYIADYVLTFSVAQGMGKRK